MIHRNSLIARALLSIACLQLALGPQVALAEAPAPPGSPVAADTSTSVTASANGTPVVNIAAPNAAGVSHNRFNQYDVTSSGLVLNNSASNAVSLLGGGVAGNAHLAPGQSAGLILNEVVAPNASRLAGYQEVLGHSADVVIANPWGISCSGCGFINTPRVTLTTGVPHLDPNGALAGFTISGGQIAIVGDGLDATRQQTLDLLARSVSASGNVIVGSHKNGISGDLQVLAGSNEFNYSTRAGTAIAGSSGAPTFAIDSSALGGMYADRIRLLVNENGAGVRVAGDLAALAEDLTIRADGRVELRGGASAARDLSIHGGSVQTQLADSNTYLYAARDLSIDAAAALSLGTGALGAQRNLALRGTTISDAGTAADLRSAGDAGTLAAIASGQLNLMGGYWTAPTVAFSGGTAYFGSNMIGYGRNGSGTALSVTTPGLLTLGGTSLYSNADALFDAQRVDIGASSVVVANGALGFSFARGGSGGFDSSGVLQGGSVSLTATGNAADSTDFRNRRGGQIFANAALSIRDDAAPGAVGGVLTNDGVLAGDSVAIDVATTTNTNAIQAASSLALNSDTLQNNGKDAVIIASSVAESLTNISASRITNSGTIWTAGSLRLQPTSLVQQREAGATANPQIAAGRDLTIAFSADGALGTGDLQAGRDLTIVGTSITDSGSTGSGNATPDLRVAGQNLLASATTGDLTVGGGLWYSGGSLDFTGTNVILGRYVDPRSGASTYASGLQISAAQAGGGLAHLVARNGVVELNSDTALFSGGDLILSQTGMFSLPRRALMQANGALVISANGSIQNEGRIFGDSITLASQNGRSFDVFNRDTGVLYAARAFHAGTPAASVGAFGISGSAPGANAGLFGGVLDIHANLLNNDGVIQAAGAGSAITTTFLTNTGSIEGFGTAAGAGSLTLTAQSLSNSGRLFDTANLRIDTGFLDNAPGAAIGSAGRLSILSSGAGGAFNRGTIGGVDVDLTLGADFQNGSDPGNPANWSEGADLFATHSLDIHLLSNSTLTNYATIESEGDLGIRFDNGGRLRNVMSMVPDSMLGWRTVGPVSSTQHGDFGLLTQGANGSTDRQKIGGIQDEYYFDTPAGNETQAYLDRIEWSPAELQFANGYDPASVPVPTIRSGNALSITGFDALSNNGTIEAARDATIESTRAGASLENSALRFQQALQGKRVVETMTCSPDCEGLSPFLGRATDYAGYTPTYVLSNIAPGGSVAFAGKVLAGGTLNVHVPTITNAGDMRPGASQSFQPAPTLTGTQASPVSVAAPGAPGTRAGATTLVISGIHIPLPASSNGRFISGASSTSSPLVETNPAFGLDSVALGSDYLTKLLGLKPEEQARRLGDDNYEAYLISQQIKSATGRSVLVTAWNTADMVQTLFDNAAEEGKALGLGYGKALTAEQIASLKSDIVWMVEQEVQGQKVLVPVVYLTDATRALSKTGSDPTLSGYNVDIKADSVRNAGAQITAVNGLKVETTGDIENVSGRMAGWNVQLKAGGDIVNSTLVTRQGDRFNGKDVAQRVATIEAGGTAILEAAHDIDVTGAFVKAGKDVGMKAGNDVNINGVKLTTNSTDLTNSRNRSQEQTALDAGVIAGGSAVIKGKNDVNLSGAWVTAGKDAALLAGHNANVSALTLTNSSSSGNSRKGNKKVEQTAAGAGVVAGGDAVVLAQNDVNLTGARIQATDGTANIRAEKGNVNIGVQELESSESSWSTKTKKYTQLDVDKKKASITLGAGVETRTTTEGTTTTTGLLSNVSGKGVVISTGQGDVNINGAQIKGSGGDVIIDSERDVNITAFNAKTESTRSSSRVRAGVQADISADEAMGGTVQSGKKVTETQTASTAVVSGITADGDGKVFIRGKGTVTNEGTKIRAGGDVILAGENVINKAAHNTTSSSRTEEKWETKQQEGITTNGTGASINNAVQGGGKQVSVNNLEFQQRVTGSYSTKTESSSTSEAVATDIQSGGHTVVIAKNKASDEGTQYTAGKNIVISAEEYENKAAHDTSHSSVENTYGSGKASVGINTSVEVAVNVSGEGGHSKSTQDQSTAKTGSMKAGGRVIIEARSGDVNLEGTQIAGKEGVGIIAARDINVTQANDTTAMTSSEQSGSGRASVSVSLIGTGGSVGAGASTRVADSTETSSTARTASIQAGNGNVQMSAGRDLNSEGTNIKAGGDVLLKAARDVNLLAATDKVDKTGSVDAGGADVTVGFGTGSAKGNGSVSGSVDFQKGQTDYHESTEHGSKIEAGGHFSVDAGRNARLQGTQVTADTGDLKTGGNLVLESARHTVKDDSYDVSGHVELSASKGGGTSGANSVGESSGSTGAKGGNAAGGNSQVNVSRSKQDIDTNTNATITTRGGTHVDVGGDMSLKGANIDAAGGVSGKVAGNLNIETRTDKEFVDQTDVKAYAGVAPVGGSGGGGKFQRGQEGVQAGANHIGQSGGLADVDVQKKDNVTVGRQSGISGGAAGIDLRVGGDTTLKGAANQGTDFKTEGKTTIASVDTHTSSSSTQFRAAGTVASIAGSDQGKGGDFNASLNLPASSRDSGTLSAPKPPESDASSAAPKWQPAQPSGPRDPVSNARKNADAQNPGSNAPTTGPNYRNTGKPAVPDAPESNYRNGGKPEAPESNYRNGGKPAAPESNYRGSGGSEGPDSSYRNGGKPAAPESNYRSSGGADGPDSAYRNGGKPVAPESNYRGGAPEAPGSSYRGDGAPQAPVSSDRNRDQPRAPGVADTGPSLPAERSSYQNSERTASNTPDAPAQEGRVRAPSVVPPSPVTDSPRVSRAPSDDDDSPYKNTEDPTGDTNDFGGSHLAMSGPPNVQAPQGRESRRAPNAVDAPPSSSSPGMFDRIAALSKRIAKSDPHTSALHKQAKKDFAAEINEINRTLAELVVFGKDPKHATQASRLLLDMQDSLKGSRQRDGQTEFPLRPQYVGENEPGFDNWKARDNGAEPGAAYKKNREIKTRVAYFTPQEQDTHRLLVDEHGMLTSGGKKLAAGEYLFVVDNRGRFIAVDPDNWEGPGALHHSTLSAGKPVRMAGKMGVDAQGRIAFLVNDSGHFRPSKEAFTQFLVDLKAQGVQLDGANATAYGFRAARGGEYKKDILDGDLFKSDDVLKGRPTGLLAPLTPPAPARDSRASSGLESAPPARSESPPARPVSDPIDVPKLRKDGESLGKEDRTQFERNLEEVLAFTALPENAQHREALLARIAMGVKGPEVENGLKQYPLQPRYVGEDVKGFDNWNTRGANANEPGAYYAKQKLLPARDRVDPKAVLYLTPEQQHRAQVYVRDDGQLAFESGRLADGDWIFVVDKQGRLIAAQAEQGRVHHSSLSAGEPVLMAGELEIRGGKLAMVTNKSGHFRPDSASFQQFLNALADQHVALDGVTARAYAFKTMPDGSFKPSEKPGEPLKPKIIDDNSAPDLRILANMKAPSGVSALSESVHFPVQELRPALVKSLPAPKRKGVRPIDAIGSRGGPSARGAAPVRPGNPVRIENGKDEVMDGGGYETQQEAPKPSAAGPKNPPTSWRGACGSSGEERGSIELLCRRAA